MRIRPQHALLIVFALLAAATILLCDGTGDSGDSVLHYQFARFAPKHPSLFFDHWAKPVFVLLACPFAQFGFIGIKVFNALVTGTTLWVTYRIALKLDLHRSWLAGLFLLCSPLFYALTFSGLTEPLFALVLTLSILLFLEERHRASLLLLSFLPFVRSEGLLIIGVFTIHLLLHRQWRLMPFLFAGTIVLSLAGWPVHHDPLWTFTRIPYASAGSPYGHGSLTHFVEDLIFITGVPVYALFWIGSMAWLVDLWKKRTITARELVPAAFWILLIAHSLFWYFGVFNSMGLIRVLVGVAPLAAIVALRGLEALRTLLSEKWPLAAMVCTSSFVAWVVVFPFTPNPAALDIDHDLMLKPDQRLAQEIGDDLANNHGSDRRVFTAAPYLALVLETDPFTANGAPAFNANTIGHLQSGDVFIWDNWFAVKEFGITEEQLGARTDLQLMGTRSATHKGGTTRFCIYAAR